MYLPRASFFFQDSRIQHDRRIGEKGLFVQKYDFAVYMKLKISETLDYAIHFLSQALLSSKTYQ